MRRGGRLRRRWIAVAAAALTAGLLTLGCSEGDRAKLGARFGGDADAQLRVADLYARGEGGLEADQAQSAAWFLRAAEAGSARGQFEAARALETGEGLARDPAAAEAWYRAAAEQGHAEARLAIASLAEARGDPPAVVRVAYERAAEAGSAAAQYRLGQAIESEGDALAASTWYRRAAEQEYDEALFRYTEMLVEGTIPEDEDVDVVVWLEKSASRGEPNAARLLAGLYHAGVRVERKPEKAFEWSLVAAEAGDVESQYRVGSHYGYGEGVTQDEAVSAVWFRKAAEAGHARAQNELGKLYARRALVAPEDEEAYARARRSIDRGLSSGQREIDRIMESGRAEKIAVTWFQRAADQGLARAMYNLGTLYSRGIGVEEDKAVALEWIKQAADLEDPDAMLALGRLYATGSETVAPDLEAAFSWFLACANGGHLKAMTVVGLAYRDGNGTPQSHALANEWLRKASDAGDLQARIQLAHQYWQGRGVEPDPAAAAELLAPAVEAGIPAAEMSVALMYQHGSGVEKDERKAFELLKTAAERDYPEAQAWLAAAYFNGTGTQKDPILSYMWFEIADTPTAHEMLVGLDQHIAQWQIKRAKQLAAEWRMRHPKDAVEKLDELR